MSKIDALEKDIQNILYWNIWYKTKIPKDIHIEDVAKLIILNVKKLMKSSND